MSAALKQATQIKIQMRVSSGPHAGQIFNLSKSTLTIGRGPENDMVLMNDPLVSRMHARIELNQGEFDLINISQKNALLVHGENVDKWKLVNDSKFQVGDSEIQFQFDLGQAASSVKPNVAVQVPRPSPALSAVKPVSDNLPVKNPAANMSSPSLQQARSPQVSQPKVHTFAQTGYSQAQKASSDVEKNKKIRFFAIIAIVALVLGYFILGPVAKGKSKKIRPVLKYEDEIDLSLSSKKEEDLSKKRDEDKKAKESPQAQRAEENFIKGMRDFQLGNYARAQDFFQVVLNLIPDHALARRHLYLSKVRFDELIQAKLMLGESNYQKHNFDMCQSMYQQVMDMLQNKSSDQKYRLAQKMAEKCQLASEGIR
ncbi:MAG: FHA domain-containing protein [Pseudobdellovibrio sp.]